MRVSKACHVTVWAVVVWCLSGIAVAQSQPQPKPQVPLVIEEVPASLDLSPASYKKPDWVSLLNTMIKFKAFDMSDNSLLDEYSMVAECELHFKNFRDDFTWQKIRQALRKSLDMKKQKFDSYYHYDLQVQLDRYDFDKEIFRFTEKSSVSRANVFELYGVTGHPCQGAEVRLLPRHFRAVINEPVTMEGLPLAEKHAQNLLKLMQADGNISRILYARFYLKVLYIEPFTSMRDPISKEVLGYGQSAAKSDNVRFDAQLDLIEFYEDAKMTKLVYTFKPQ